MGLPNNFLKQEPQLTKRWDSLNELSYYKVEFTLYLNGEFFDEIKEEGEEALWELEQELGLREDPMGRGGYGPPETRHLVKHGVKTFASLDTEKAKNTFDGWVEGLKVQGVITDINVISFEENTLMEELDRIDILPILNLEGRN